MLRFEWDERKNRSNRTKHGVWFEAASVIRMRASSMIQNTQRFDFMKKEYDFSKMKELKNPSAGKKQAVGINLSPEVVDYFKGLADETGLPYQKLIDLYLLDCAKRRKKLMMKWVA